MFNSKSSIPIGAKVEISPQGLGFRVTLGVKAELEKKIKIQSAQSY
jgi:hypothetical protein